MCGIMGYVGACDAVPFLLAGLRRLEYRGYDSAGLAIINGSGLEVAKTPGKIAALETRVAGAALHGRLGIGHTRWATHGRPTECNAHPHTDCGSRVAVVHNGIIENHEALRRTLCAEGHRFRSQTDTEVIAHLVERYLGEGLPDAVRHATRDLHGAYAIACIAADDPTVLVAARGGNSPLVIGLGDGEAFLASDVPALLGVSERTVVLGDGEIAVLRRDGVSLRTLDGQEIHRAPTRLPCSAEAAEKSSYPHFMLKEIFEQPDAVRNTLLDRADADTGEIRLPELDGSKVLSTLNRVQFVACGTSWHAGLVGKHLVEVCSGVPATAEIASEFHAGGSALDDRRVLTVPISQSGETADTLAALRAARDAGSHSVAICNVVGSSLARLAHRVVQTRAGIEIGVASTKAFTAQLSAVTLMALKLGLVTGRLDPSLVRTIVKDLCAIPALMADLLGLSDAIRNVAARFADRQTVLYLGRGLHYPMALEGALKLKEISYIHAEGYPAGEMKHGPISLIDARTPVVCVALRGPSYEKMASNIEEVKARDGVTIALTTAGDAEGARQVDVAIPVPPAPYWLQPLLAAIPLQLFAYHIGVLRGCDVDQPRNLAKSVTVE
ncbi:MAG: glutamine--fructose-6-phosphate transaminase (isomerizing) [Acidobacteria bacterium]|nr:glutamine--fructose-6-phosphate transaminase (isomerizing) [Acidobacteriota bacterium]